MDYLCSPKSLEAGQGCVRSLQGHTRVFGDFFLFIHECFEVSSILCLHMILREDDLCVALFFSSYIFIYYYWEADS